MLIVPAELALASASRRGRTSVPGIWRLRLVEVVARVAGEEERDNKSAYPEEQDRHRPADREPGDHASCSQSCRVIRLPFIQAETRPHAGLGATCSRKARDARAMPAGGLRARLACTVRRRGGQRLIW